MIWEVFSGTVLGYSVAFGTNYTAADICQAVQRALVPWKPRDLSGTKLKYKKRDCLPNAAHPGLANICFDNMFVDRALANMADDLRTYCEATVRCAILPGAISHPNARAEIENMFHQIEEAIFHNLSISTGSNPSDKRADNGGRKTPRFATLAFVMDLIDLVICRWNNSNATGCSQTRNELLVSDIERGVTLFRRIPQVDQPEILKYDMIVNHKFNKHGELYWEGADYALPKSALVLKTKDELINQEILIRANSADVREIEIRLRESGLRLGIFRIEDRFYGIPQPLLIRRLTRGGTRGKGFAESSADLSLAARFELISGVERGQVDAAHLARMIHDAQRLEEMSSAEQTGGDVGATNDHGRGEHDTYQPGDTEEVDEGLDESSDDASDTQNVPTAVSDYVRRRLAKLGTST